MILPAAISGPSMSENTLRAGSCGQAGDEHDNDELEQLAVDINSENLRVGGFVQGVRKHLCAIRGGSPPRADRLHSGVEKTASRSWTLSNRQSTRSRSDMTRSFRLGMPVATETNALNAILPAAVHKVNSW